MATTNQAASAKGRMFENPLLESLTKTHIAFPLTVFYTTSIAVVGYEIIWNDLPAIYSILVAVGGMLTWSLIEYLAHRFIFHFEPKSERGKRIIRALHGLHHEVPHDTQRLAMPVPMSALLAVFFLWFYDLTMGTYGWCFGAGFIAGYASYLTVHYITHAWKAPKNMFNVLWKTHSIHHHVDHEIYFGVSSPLWDYVFRTLPAKNQFKAGKTTVKK